jgi:hypothetical protein
LLQGYLTYKKFGESNVDSDIVKLIDAFVDVVKQNNGKIQNRLLESLCKTFDQPFLFFDISPSAHAFFDAFFNDPATIKTITGTLLINVNILLKCFKI